MVKNDVTDVERLQAMLDSRNASMFIGKPRKKEKE